ncbi:MAG: diaminopimelate decarboxylase [bacterium]|nr:diaminopimelate decarboxylase [bacterium]
MPAPSHLPPRSSRYGSAGADVTAVRRDLLPDSAEVGSSGRLSIGGCDVLELVSEHGTPLFIYDETHLRTRCREAVAGFPDGVAYATKAFLCGAMARLAYEEGMDLDVATGGELAVALRAGVPADRLVFHGNNKSSAELAAAIDVGVKRVVVDNSDELDRLENLHRTGYQAPSVLIRVNPAVEAHTHEYLQTGIADSKFGFPLDGGEAAAAVMRARASSAMDYHGVHAHIGSQVYATSSFRKALEVLAPFVEESGATELSVGGGLGVAYVGDETAPTISDWAHSVAEAAGALGIACRITAEPGRSIVASAAVTAYTVGVIKPISGIRTYVAVDGGMSDNPRPVLYGSGYEAFLARRTDADRTMPVRIVGKHCESGDVIVAEAMVPDDIAIDDVLVTPVTGAYGHSMGSNYNMALRPPVVFVSNGAARLVVRRETHEDLLRRDVGI